MITPLIASNYIIYFMCVVLSLYQMRYVQECVHIKLLDVQMVQLWMCLLLVAICALCHWLGIFTYAIFLCGHQVIRDKCVSLLMSYNIFYILLLIIL